MRFATAMLVSALIAVTATAVEGAAGPAAYPEIPSDRADKYLAGYADCVVAHKSYRARVELFLRTVPGSQHFGPNGLAAADMHCLDGAARQSGGWLQMRMPPAAFREALYPALYRRDFARIGPVAGIAALPPLLPAGEFDGGGADLAPDYLVRRALGDCTARAAPQPAHALLVANPNSPQEKAAVALLKPALASCLSRGQTVRLTLSTIRGVVGEAMYKLSRAAKG